MFSKCLSSDRLSLFNDEIMENKTFLYSSSSFVRVVIIDSLGISLLDIKIESLLVGLLLES